MTQAAVTKHAPRGGGGKWKRVDLGGGIQVRVPIAHWNARDRAAWRWPGRMKASRWMEHYRYLSKSAIPGPWRNENAPYLVGMMDLATAPGVEELDIKKAAQLGVSQMLRGLMGYWAQQDPEPMGLALPSKEKGREIVENDVMPFFLQEFARHDELRELMSPRAHDIKKGQIKLANAFLLYLMWSGSPASMASNPMKRALSDEADKFAAWAGNDADPISLIEKRMRTYPDRIHIVVSTPTGPEGTITIRFNQTHVKLYYLVACPHCGYRQRLVFGEGGDYGVKWTSEIRQLVREGKREQASARAMLPGEVWYECCNCHGKIDERQKRAMSRAGTWGTVMGDGVRAEVQGDLTTESQRHGGETTKQEGETGRQGDKETDLTTEGTEGTEGAADAEGKGLNLKVEKNASVRAPCLCDSVVKSWDGGPIFDANAIERWPAGTRIGMQISSLYCCWEAWTMAHVAAEFLMGATLAQRFAFRTSTLGETWAQAIDSLPVEVIDKRVEESTLEEGIVPRWAARLIASVDTQQDHFWLVIRAWGPGMRSARVWHGKVASFQEIEQYAWKTPWKNEDDRLPARLCDKVVIDTGGTRRWDLEKDSEALLPSRVMEVYAWILKNQAIVNGIKGDARPEPGHYMRRGQGEFVSDRERKPVPLWLLDVHHFQDQLADMMGKRLPLIELKTGEQIGTYPQWSLNKRVDAEYARHMAAMHKVTEMSRGKRVEVYRPKREGMRVDYRAVEGYQIAGAFMTAVHLLPDEVTYMAAVEAELARKDERATGERRPGRFDTPDGRAFVASQR